VAIDVVHSYVRSRRDDEFADYADWPRFIQQGRVAGQAALARLA
jgi:hypothetical protein